MEPSARQCLPSTLSPFARALIESGEAIAYLHLSGNHCTSLVDDTAVGTVHQYSVKLRDDQPEDERLQFDYEVLGVFDAHFGKCVAYRPLHDPERTVIAFRGVRIDVNGAEGNANDVNSMLERRLCRLTWLPPKARMSIGICRHGGAIWGCAKNGGLVEFVRSRLPQEGPIHFTGLSLAGSLAQLMALRCCTDPTLSIGERAHVLTFGALPFLNAEASRLYEAALSSQCAHLVSRLFEAGSLAAEQRAEASEWWMGAEAAQIGAEASARPPPKLPAYAVLDPLTVPFMREVVQPSHTFAIDSDPLYVATDCGDAFSIYSVHSFWSSANGAAVSDHVDDDGGAARLHEIGEWPTRTVDRLRVLRLMTNRLDDTDGLHIDFLRLHRGKAYKTALTALCNSAVRASKTHAQELPARSAPTAAAAPDAAAPSAADPMVEKQVGEMATAATGGRGMQRASSKRALSEMLGEAADADAAEPLGERATTALLSESTGGMRRTSSKRALSEILGEAGDAAVDENQPLPRAQSRDGLSKLASHGSMADRLDEIAMF